METTSALIPKNKARKKYVWRRPKRTEYRFRWPDRLVPHMPFLIFFILAVFQYNARLTGDTALYTFEIINKGFFWTPHHNAGMYLPQLLPLTGIWLGLNMRVILLLFSLSHVVFYYFIFLFTYYGIGDRRSGLLIILINTAGIIHSFFSPATAIYYASALLILFYALLRLNIRAVLMTVFLVLLELITLLTHPAAFLILLFIMFLDFNKEKLRDYSLYGTLLLVYLGAFLLERLVWNTPFLNSAVPFFGEIQNQTFSSKDFSIPGFLTKFYPELLVAGPLALLAIMKEQNWYKLVVTVIFMIIWMMILPHAAQLPPVEREQVGFPLVLIIFIPLIYSYPKEWNPGVSYFSILIISLLIMIRTIVIYNHSFRYVMRAKQISHIIEAAWRHGGSKFTANPEVIERYGVASSGSYPLESLLLSSCYGSDRCVTVILRDSTNGGQKNKTSFQQFYLTPHLVEQTNSLKNRHLHLDIGPYRPLNSTKPNENIREIAGQFNVEVNPKKIYKSTDTVFVPVKISCLSNDTLFTGGVNEVYISYFWIRNGETIEWNNILTPLDADIIKELRQDVKVFVPETKGWLDLNIDIRANGQWFGLRTTKTILVY